MINLPSNTKIPKSKTEKFDYIDERLDWLWYNSPHPIHGGGHKIKINQEKICNITFEKRGNMELYFIRFDRHSDMSVFHTTNEKGRYIPKPEFKDKINFVISGDFGSANLAFICNDYSLKLVLNTLISNKYDIGLRNYLE